MAALTNVCGVVLSRIAAACGVDAPPLKFYSEPARGIMRISYESEDPFDCVGPLLSVVGSPPGVGEDTAGNLTGTLLPGLGEVGKSWNCLAAPDDG